MNKKIQKISKPITRAKAKERFLNTHVPKRYLAINGILAIFYFVLLVFFFPRGNMWLFYALAIGEVFHLWQIGTYIHSVWGMDTKHRFNKKIAPPVDVFITVAGEPLDIIERTVIAAKNANYPKLSIYILNDGKVANKDNWKDVEKLARRIGVGCITRQVPGGAKAGNINNALKHTASPFIAVFDADHIPDKDFFKKTMGYFIDDKMAFVQTPQYYRNQDLNYVTKAAWEQQELFFGPLCRGKNRTNSVFMCGTNMVLRRKALEEVGGLNEKNITEDLLTALFIHANGWKSTYVPEVLSEGLAPEDLNSYYKQQSRWARGSLEVIFKYNPLFKKNLTWHQKLEYLASASFFLSGWVVLMNAALPLIFLFTGLSPLDISTPFLAIVFLPYIFMTIFVLIISSNYSYTYKAVAFSMSLFLVHMLATLAAILRVRSTFTVTPKKAVSGNFMKLAIPHMAYIAAGIAGLSIGILREGVSAAMMANMSWIIFNAGMFAPFIFASMPISPKEPPIAAEEEKTIEHSSEETRTIKQR